MSEPVERFSAETLVERDLGARVLRPLLDEVQLHWHDYYELSLVLRGTAEHVVNGRAMRIERGSAFLLSPADLHSLRSLGPEPVECFNVVLDADLVEHQLAALGAGTAPGLPWLVEDFLDAEDDLVRLARELEHPRPGARRVAEALVACLVVELARRGGADESAVREQRRSVDAPVRDAVLFVDRHFREPLTLADAAARAHLSPNYFSERFRRVAGTPFQLYLQERRLRFAHSLLVSTGLSVTEVCHAAGFNDLSHFGRAYHRRYGVPPSRR